MALQTLAYLKSKFETGDVPTQQDFVDLIDTLAAISETDRTAIINSIQVSLDSQLSQKAAVNHAHSNYALQADLVAGLTAKANAGHSHSWDSIKWVAFNPEQFNYEVPYESMTVIADIGKISVLSGLKIGTSLYYIKTIVDEGGGEYTVTADRPITSNTGGISVCNADDLILSSLLHYTKAEVDNLMVSETAQVTIENPSNTETNKYVSARRFWQGLTKFVSLAWTWALKQTFTTAPRFSSTTASLPLKVNVDKDLISEQIKSGDIEDGAVSLAKIEALALATLLGGGATGNEAIETTQQMGNAVPAGGVAAGTAYKTASGAPGMIAKDDDYLYICYDIDSWCAIAIEP